MDATYNGAAVLEADLILPHEGRWTADVQADLTETPEAGSSGTLRLLGRDYQGTVLAVGTIGGRTHLRLAGGAGGMDGKADAKHYRNDVSASLLWQDLLQALGETAASSSDQQVLGRTLPKWTRTAAWGLDLLGELADKLEATWRVLADGSVWIGVDTWAPAPETDWILTGGTPEAGRITIAAETCTVDPGQSLDGLRVHSLMHTVRPGASRTVLVLDESGNPLYRLIDRWMRRRGYDYARPQPGKAVTQDADGTLQVQLDHPDYPPLRSVPIRPGLADTDIKIGGGARVLVEWAGGDPGAPYVTAWGDSTATEIKIGDAPGQPAREVARKNDTVEVDLYFITATVGVAGAPVVIGISPVPVPPPATSVKVTLTMGKITSGSSILKAGG